MLVTITTDASFYDKHKVGAYAFWIASDGGKIRKAGVFKGEINSSHEAEFKCIINAVHALVKSNIKPTKIIINTDSMTVIRRVKSKHQFNIGNVSLMEKYRDMVKMLGVDTVIFKHVKGHSNGKTPRQWVNNWCDSQAKHHAKKKIFGDDTK